MSQHKISVDQIVVGMCVVGLDVSWLKTPFLSHRIRIESQMQIDTIRQCGAKVVTIDTELGSKPAPINPAPATSDEPPRRPPPKPSSFEGELASAQRLRAATRTALNSTIALLQNDKPLQMAPLGRAVDLTIESLMRNNRALATLFHQKGRGSPLVNHSINMMNMSLLMGQQLQYDERELQLLGTAALLADIGWSRLPAELFNLRTAYTDDEFHLAREHVRLGIEVLQQSEVDEQLIRIIQEHHERFDGSGYPHQVCGTTIHPMSRIISLVDHFDSAIYGYYDSGPVIPTTALSNLYKNGLRGPHEPALVKVLISLVGIYPVSSAVLLNSGECGMVTRVNWRKPLQPRVKLFYNQHRQALVRPFEIDLAQQSLPTGREERTIKRVIDPSIPGEDPAGLLRFEEE